MTKLSMISKIENDQVVNDRSLEDPTKLIKNPEAKKPEDWDDRAKIDDAEGAEGAFFSFLIQPKFLSSIQ